jgi:hypothetical protein
VESSCARRYAVVRRAGDGLRAALPDVPLARLAALVAAAAGMRATAPFDVALLYAWVTLVAAQADGGHPRWLPDLTIRGYSRVRVAALQYNTIQLHLR